jgi:periplasmic divalent cation tolerance protein
MLLIFSTYPNPASARRVVKLVFDKRLAGCVLTIPLGSMYRWKGKLTKTKEVLLVYKTTKEKVKKCMRLIEAHHPYEVPFVATLPLKEVSKKYQQWLVGELGKG